MAYQQTKAISYHESLGLGYCRARVLRPRTFLFPLSPTTFFNCIHFEISLNKNKHKFTFTATIGCLTFCKPDIFTPLLFSFQEKQNFDIFVKILIISVLKIKQIKLFKKMIKKCQFVGKYGKRGYVCGGELVICPTRYPGLLSRNS